MKFAPLAFAAAAALLSACASTPEESAPVVAAAPVSGSSQPGPATASHVDLNAYMGRWYVLAHIPDPASEDYHKVASNFDYALHDDGRIEMRHNARPLDFTHPYVTTVGEARIIDSKNNGRWRIKTGWLLSREYLILQVGTDYGYAVVGDGTREHAWVLSRQARMTDEMYAQLMGFLDSRGYNSKRMLKIPQIEDQFGAPGYQ